MGGHVLITHYCSNILTFAPDGTITRAILKAPGSWHDSHIAEQLYGTLLNNTPPGFRCLANTAFPCCTDWLNYRILAPKKKGERLPSDPTKFARLKVLNKQVVSARQAAEWGMRALQGSFGRLKLPLPASNHKAQANIIHLAVRLHQLWCQSVGINQTATVYQDVENKFHLLTRDFHRMLFPKIQ
jgi:hypothetical protein